MRCLTCCASRQIADYYASCANPFQSKLMPWPGRIVANAMP